MGQHVSRSDYEWSYTEEPHRSRRQKILAKHPEVKTLMVSDPMIKWTVCGMVLAQVISAYLMRDASWVTILLLAYCWGGVINHSLTLAIHEISHNTAFGYSYTISNKLLGIFGNMPMAIPYSVVFKKYHSEHHKYQGHDGVDVDIPSDFEARMFTRTFTKFLWLLLQPVFYTLRPICVHPKPITMWEVLNFVVQATFDISIWYFMGWKSLFYLAVGTFLAMGLHPVAGHFVSEHYMFKKGFETYSYYGPLNLIAFNVGYHNEHHDFPNVPGCKLPELKKMCPEFYDDLPCHTSWVRVLYDFVMDPAIGPYARVKRRRRAKGVNIGLDNEDYDKVN